MSKLYAWLLILAVACALVGRAEAASSTTYRTDLLFDLDLPVVFQTPPLPENRGWSMCNNTAVQAAKNGDYAAAEQWHLQALEIAGGNAGSTYAGSGVYAAMSCGNLASLYQTLGKWEDAERFYVQSVRDWEQALGPQHPAVCPAPGFAPSRATPASTPCHRRKWWQRWNA